MLIIPLGIAAFIVFYVVFRFAIVKFDLKTPGREDDDEDETKVVLANNDFTAVAKIILEGVGGTAERVHNTTTASQDFVLRSKTILRLMRKRSNQPV